MKPKFIHSNISKYKETNGWFLGYFMKDKGFPELYSQDLEIAWKKVDHSLSDPKHFHKKGLEINIVIKGGYKVLVNDEVRKINEGEFLILFPNTTLEILKTKDDTEIIVIKTPSIKNDKFNI